MRINRKQLLMCNRLGVPYWIMQWWMDDVKTAGTKRMMNYFSKLDEKKVNLSSYDHIRRYVIQSELSRRGFHFSDNMIRSDIVGPLDVLECVA